jgi:hypothetical protein
MAHYPGKRVNSWMNARPLKFLATYKLFQKIRAIGVLTTGSDPDPPYYKGLWAFSYKHSLENIGF